MKSFFLSLTMLSLIFGSSRALAGPQYEDHWHHDVDVGISRTLASHNIHGCGLYKYKANVKYPNSEYLVFCSTDGEQWLAYQVWTKIDKVLGPYPPDSNFK